MDGDFVTITEAATLLGVSRQKVGRMVRAGRLTGMRSALDARAQLIPREEVERLKRVEGRNRLALRELTDVGET